MIVGPTLEFGPHAEFPYDRTVRKIYREGTLDWIGVLIEERMTPEELLKRYPEIKLPALIGERVEIDGVVWENIGTVAGSSDGPEQSVDNRQVAGSTPAPPTKPKGYCLALLDLHEETEYCVRWKPEDQWTGKESIFDVPVSESQAKVERLGFCDNGTKKDGAVAHPQLKSCVNWHIDCPCWETGKFVRVEGCTDHPYDL